jgi:outer membrane protein OmpA-like peptidoglycan-associated protein
MKPLVLILEGLLAATAALADEPRLCQTEAACQPCAKDGKCTSVHGKRIDHGASLGARSTPADAERELGTETYVLSDANLMLPMKALPRPPRKKATAVQPVPVVQASTPAVTPEAAQTSPPAQAKPAGGTPALQKRVVERRETQPGERTELAPSSFISGGSELGPVLKTRLDELAAHLKKHQNIRIQVIGHTDTQRLSPRTRAKYRDNQGLGQARADIVAGYLAEMLGLTPEIGRAHV